ncbi:IPTL-CTERM sorting domain-containing protein [Lampropedia aestuarii]|nr:IPTL-CTERM sorting domain-containing protein [Lampropedia aestuarii]
MYKYLCLLPLSLCITAGAWADTVTGTLTVYDKEILTWKSDDLKYADGTSYSQNPQYLVCMDKTSPGYGNGGTFSFEGKADINVFLGSPNPGEAGIAAMHWLFDNYYENYNDLNVHYLKRRAFQYAVWELGNDYNGDINSIDANNGNVKASGTDEITYYGQLFHDTTKEIHAAMHQSLVGLPTSYRSKKYDISFLKTTDQPHQSLVAFNVKNTPPLPPTTTPVPTLGEWSVISLTLGVGLFGFIRLRKKHQS